MNCEEIYSALLEGKALSADADEHLKGCATCQRAAQVLWEAPSAVELSHALTERIELRMMSTLEPVRPMLSRRLIWATLAVIYISIVVAASIRAGTYGLSAMAPWQTAAILLTLTVATGLLVHSLASQMSPGSRHIVLPDRVPLWAGLALAGAIFMLFRVQEERNFWLHNWACLRFGTLVAVATSLPAWLILRRGAVLSPMVTGATFGIFTGFAGAGVLELHCPILNVSHILTSHLGVVLLATLVGLAVGFAFDSVRKYSANGELA
ncbi:MAG: NrsF family protein [Bryobacteraceae bacterium]